MTAELLCPRLCHQVAIIEVQPLQAYAPRPIDKLTVQIRQCIAKKNAVELAPFLQKWVLRHARKWKLYGNWNLVSYHSWVYTTKRYLSGLEMIYKFLNTYITSTLSWRKSGLQLARIENIWYSIWKMYSNVETIYIYLLEILPRNRTFKVLKVLDFFHSFMQ